MKRVRFMIFLSVLVLGLTAAAYAQELVGAQADPSGVVVIEPRSWNEAAPREPVYGTLDFITYTVPIQNFMLPNNTVTWATSGLGAVYQTSGVQIDWWAPVVLPSGALVSSIEMEACDSTATGQTLFGMSQVISPGVNGWNITSVGSTGTSATPGCAFFPINLTTPVTIDNENNIYLLFADWEGNFTSNNRIHAVRIFYNLQVSPAPGTATFSDVPTGHSYFQYIEALAASGITVGCGGGNYCPDSYLTRGQMAVFLSRALGLHWPY